ncbi:MAG: formate dehydrogenase accessory sulfurtransferase FdhD [bacterium]|nr:formate dehydrogenase accessory sulfurtransferase FdhD [bacterium]
MPGDRPATSVRPVTRWQGGEASEVQDVVAAEAPLTIYLNGHELVTLLATPENLDELAVGFLRTEGFVESREDLRSLEVDPGRGVAEVTTSEHPDFTHRFYGRRVVSSGCAGPLSLAELARLRPLDDAQSRARVTVGRLLELTAGLKHSPLFQLTGGTHCALADLIAGESAPLLREDIGRHNAVDKIIGRLTLDGARPDQRLLATSGRISSDLVRKAVGVGIPIVVSRSAPTGLAVEMAGRLGLTLAGFARGNRLNVYTGHDRLGGG